MKPPKIIILPGNGVTDFDSTHWYGWLRDKLNRLGFNVIGQDMPDHELARKDIWLPHIKNKFQAGKDTIIIGHSSGGVATLRYLETSPLMGAIVIGVNHTDLGYQEKKQSGYFDTPWQWEKIKSNAKWLVQFCSQDDPYIPIKEPRFIHEKLNSEYHEYTNRGHFGSEHTNDPKFPELIEVIKRKLISHDQR